MQIMNIEKNPFLIYDYESPEYFCDRKKETERLAASLLNGCNVTLMSPRRMGKTGLIKNVFHYLKQQDIACFYVDIYATKSLQDFVEALGKEVIGKLDTPIQRAEGFVMQFFRSCKLTFSADPVAMMPQVGLQLNPQDVRCTLDEIFAYIAQSGRTCCLAIDEFQQIADYDDASENNLEALLRTYAQKIHNVHFIFSGSRQHVMSVLFDSPRHPFYRSTERQHIGPLDEAVYHAFAQEKLQQKSIVLPAEQFHQIYSRVDGVTWYVQKILNHLYRLPPCTVSAQDVQGCMRDIILSEAEDYRRMLHLLTANQANLLKAIAMNKTVSEPLSGAFVCQSRLKSSSSVQRAFEYLDREEYVYRAEEGCMVYDRFLAMWLRGEF